jgi:phosphate transport system protein
LAELALTQLKEVLDAYASRSVERIGMVRNRDDQIDAMYTSLFRELLTYMMEDPRSITSCTHLLFCAKNIERIGDHATNIAETLYYIITGEQLPVERPKEDESHKVVAGIGKASESLDR